MKKILFTGEKGSLARTIMQLLSTDHFKVVGVDHQLASRASGHHAWPELDVTTGALEEAVMELKPDVIVHSAAVVNTDKCHADPSRAVDVNFRGTGIVLDLCEAVGADLVYFSTTATYDPAPDQHRPYTELSRQRPPTLYGITKYAGELLVTGQKKVRNVVIRPCFVYGNPPWDHSSQLVRVGVHSALREWWRERAASEAPRVTLDPFSRKDYMRVEDFAAAVVEILSGEFWGETFNVSHGLPNPMGWYFEKLEEFLGIKLHMDWAPEDDYMGDHVVSSNRLRALTNWAPRIKQEDGVRMLADHIYKYVEESKAGRLPMLYR